MVTLLNNILINTILFVNKLKNYNLGAFNSIESIIGTDLRLLAANLDRLLDIACRKALEQ